MAAARKKGKKGKPGRGAHSKAASAETSDGTESSRAGEGEQPSASASSEQGRAAPAVGQRDIRPYIYAGFDAAMAVIYLVLLVKVFPSTHGSTQLLAYTMILAAVVMGAGMFVRNEWGWRMAVAGCAALLLIAVLILVLLLISAAFLAGVYGAFGQAASMVTLVAAAITIEIVALVPALQMKFLMTRAGRRYFGRAPLWQ